MHHIQFWFLHWTQDFSRKLDYYSIKWVAFDHYHEGSVSITQSHMQHWQGSSEVIAMECRVGFWWKEKVLLDRWWFGGAESPLARSHSTDRSRGICCLRRPVIQTGRAEFKGQKNRPTQWWPFAFLCSRKTPSIQMSWPRTTARQNIHIYTFIFGNWPLHWHQHLDHRAVIPIMDTILDLTLKHYAQMNEKDAASALLTPISPGQKPSNMDLSAAMQFLQQKPQSASTFPELSFNDPTLLLLVSQLFKWFN